MNPRQELASHWEAVFDQIDATMHTAPEEALTLCKQVFVESYLWEPPVYVRAAERYGKIMDHLGKSTEARDSLFAAQQAAQGSCEDTGAPCAQLLLERRLPACDSILEQLHRCGEPDWRRHGNVDSGQGRAGAGL
jgi:hypothetical protein